MRFPKPGLLSLLIGAAPAMAPINAGTLPPTPSPPFKLTKVAQFDQPWRIAFLPDGRMLVTEKPGKLFIATETGRKLEVAGVPAVHYQGQNGLLGVYLAPSYASDGAIYLTYSEPGPETGTSSLALARATLKMDADAASLEDLKVVWHDPVKGKGGQVGAAVAFSPDRKFLFLTAGDRQRFTPAQDPNQPAGKILRLTLDGKPAPGNPMEGKVGATSVELIDPPRDTEAAKTAPVVRTVVWDGPNLTPAETWTTGHRTPYGLAFAPDGRLWELEHGPRGGDELNLIEPGKNYGWPLVAYGTDYDGTPIPSPDTRPDLT
ncbi:MAG TPA: PQQ-dependent sugar dehydrogenase, partial [Burkholderiaceae bacterium]